LDGADEHTYKIYSESIIFLASEGFLRFSGSFRPTGEDFYTIWFEDVVLTSKGLTILNSIPDVLQERTTLGQKLNNALKGGASEVFKTIVDQIISTAVTGYMSP
jgi:hypothetical protein